MEAWDAVVAWDGRIRGGREARYDVGGLVRCDGGGAAGLAGDEGFFDAAFEVDGVEVLSCSGVDGTRISSEVGNWVE